MLKLISCLSRSWGGMEIVSVEMADLLANAGTAFYFICLEDSPIHKKLKEKNYSYIALRSANFFSAYKKLKTIDFSQVDTIALHKLSDISIFLPFIRSNRHKIVGFSHSFLAVNKKDFWHRYAYSKFFRIIALTKRHAKNLLNYLPINENQIDIIPNSVDLNRFDSHKKIPNFKKSLGWSESSFLIGLVSRLDPGKGQKVALDALQILKNKKLNCKIVFIGENTKNEIDYETDLKKIAAQYGLLDDVKFMGFNENVAPIVASLDALIQPSVAETFGKSIIEGMASEVPVISTNAGGVPDIITDSENGLLVEPQNAYQLAEAIELIIKNNQLVTHMTEVARNDVVNKYSKKVVNQHLVRVLDIE